MLALAERSDARANPRLSEITEEAAGITRPLLFICLS
jgi:hypothetical protein